jgi:Fe-S-cluster containining protein
MKCKENCGECCGIVPIPKELAKKTEHLAQVKPKEVIEIEGNLYILPEDMLCVYLNRKAKRCMIYNQRPEICKEYGESERLPCPHFKANGERRTFTERKLMQAKIDKDVNDRLRIIENVGI